MGDALKSYKADVFLLANMTEFGKTPMIPLSDFEKAGYSCVIYPVSTLRVAQLAAQKLLQTLKKEGSVEKELGNMLTRKELYSLLKYEPGEEWVYPSPKEPKL